LWDHPARLTIADARADTWASSMREPSDGSGDVAGITIDDILTLTNWDRIDLLKLDIEGAEFALFGSQKTNWLSKVGAIAIELHDRFQPGCSRVFYEKVLARLAAQEIRGESVFVLLNS
jgi:FkbM family methyltransferase